MSYGWPGNTRDGYPYGALSLFISNFALLNIYS